MTDERYRRSLWAVTSLGLVLVACAPLAPATIVYVDLDDASVVRGNWDPAVEASNANTALNNPEVMIYLVPQEKGACRASA
jgi:hypothetical protein